MAKNKIILGKNKPVEKQKINHYLLILDKSGSMLSVKDSIIESYNATINTIKKTDEEFENQKSYISLILFADDSNVVMWKQSAELLGEINSKTYLPGGSTALLDAIGVYCNRLSNELKQDFINDDVHVVVTILTDGEENSSTHYSKGAINQLIKTLKDSGNWTITFIGTEGIIQQAYVLGLDKSNIKSYVASPNGVKNMTNVYSASIANYAAKRSVDSEDVIDSFFVESETKDEVIN